MHHVSLTFVQNFTTYYALSDRRLYDKPLAFWFLTKDAQVWLFKIYGEKV